MCGDAQADAERCGDDQHAASIQRRLREDAHAGSRHRAEHHQGRAAEHRFRNLLQHRADHREQAEAKQNRANVQPDVAAGDAGQLNHAVVLRERSIGKSAEGRGDHAADAIAEYATAQAAYIRRAADRLTGEHAVGSEVADGFDGADQIN
ncbi:hypothetical protein D3C78_1441710 [compost metagenome]